LATSEIDISKFKGHSTRATAVSAADSAGVLKDIMPAAGWSSCNTFKKFYKTSVQTGNDFAKSILQSALL
jgi:hypothetical protein